MKDTQQLDPKVSQDLQAKKVKLFTASNVKALVGVPGIAVQAGLTAGKEYHGS